MARQSREGKCEVVATVTGVWLVVFALQWILLLTLFVILAGFLRYFATIEERLNQSVPRVTKFQPGDLIGDFELPQLGGGEVARTTMIGARWLLLLLSPSCSSCEAVARQVAELANRPPPIGWAI